MKEILKSLGIDCPELTEDESSRMKKVLTTVAQSLVDNLTRERRGMRLDAPAKPKLINFYDKTGSVPISRRWITHNTGFRFRNYLVSTELEKHIILYDVRMGSQVVYDKRAKEFPDTTKLSTLVDSLLVHGTWVDPSHLLEMVPVSLCKRGFYAQIDPNLQEISVSKEMDQLNNKALPILYGETLVKMLRICKEMNECRIATIGNKEGIVIGNQWLMAIMLNQKKE